MVMDTLGSSFDTVLAVYTGPGTNFESLVPVACNNDAGETATWSRVTFATTAATVYYVAVDGVGGVSGTVQLNYELTAHEPLTITTQPQSQVVGIASTATFTVHATGTGPLNYQWRRNGTPLTHPNSNTLLLPGVRSEDEAEYVAVVSDFNGSTSSAPATLTVCSVVPATNHVAVEQVWLEGQPCMRVAGHAAAGAVLEASSDLRQWQPVCTNQSALGLFSFDDPALMPRRFYRILLP
ncbi:MAG: immunoglobulin domain-containing protein [Verrucomicrobia bacterium]|nr:immunoglobulin domain-containing protein [Verrucomicrobiota bacterium]